VICEGFVTDKSHNKRFQQTKHYTIFTQLEAIIITQTVRNGLMF